MACQISVTPDGYLSSIIKESKDERECCVCLCIKNLTIVFECKHAMCLICFKQYSITKLNSRQFKYDPDIGYSLGCPNGCSNTLLRESHIFRLMNKSNYEKYKEFAAEEYIFHHQGIICPTPFCGSGLLLDETGMKINCPSSIGCGKTFCRSCKEVWKDDNSEICSCQDDQQPISFWAQLFKFKPLISSTAVKKCPSCSVQTEKDGGCNAISCTRCGTTWCWICEREFRSDCIREHWF